MQPFLSIITINFNDAVGLEKTINSVKSQSFVDFEFIVIDGGSSDSSVNCIQKYVNNINYWVSEKDSGIYNAMNKGIRVSSGNYLLFLNSGDVLNGKTALQDFVSHPNFTGDIIYGDYKFNEGEKVYPDYLTPLFFIKSSLPHQSTFFHKSVFEKMGNYDEKFKIVADRAFYIKCFLSNKFNFKHINYSLSIFDLSGMSNDKKFIELKKSEDNQAFKEYYGVFYEDYINFILQQNKLNHAKRFTVVGIVKRIINKIKFICLIR